MAEERAFGYVAISRKLYSTDPFWNEPRVFSRHEAWEDMIQMAAYRSHRVAAGSVIVELRRGEVLASQSFLARRWRWSEKKVRNFLALLFKMDRLRAGQETPAGQSYLLVNYDHYQAQGRSEGRARDGAETEAGRGRDRGRTEAGRETEEGKKEEEKQVSLTAAEGEREGALPGTTVPRAPARGPEPIPLEPTVEEHSVGEYVQAIERALGAVGGPSYIRPLDWQVVHRWYREGRPLDLVLDAIRRVFERRRDRGERDRVNSLRYCEQEIDRAWRLYRELVAPGERGRPEQVAEILTAARLQALAAALPADLLGREELLADLEALAGNADSEEVEAELSAMDGRMLRTARHALKPEDEEELRHAVQRTLDAYGARLDAEQLLLAGDRLWAQVLRDRLKLPILSLFSPEAQAGNQPRTHDAVADSSPGSPAHFQPTAGADRRLEGA